MEFAVFVFRLHTECISLAYFIVWYLIMTNDIYTSIY